MKFILLIFSLIVFANAYDLSDALRVNGYGNFYIIHSDNEKSEDEEKHINTSGGIQANYQITDDISTTAQIYLEEEEKTNRNDALDLDVNWLYLDYYIGHDITLRAGIFQFPIFKSAETGAIGYTMTWTETPLESYGANGYEDFTGVELLKKYFYDDFEFLIQLSYGKSKNDLPRNFEDETVEGKTNSLAGITLKTTYDWFNLNVGYLQAKTKVKNTISGPFGFTFTEKVDFYMIALEGQIDWEDWSLKAGFIKAQLSDEFFPDERRYYTSLEYRYQDFTPYIYYAEESLNFGEIELFPKDKLLKSTLNSFSIGTRYDFNEYIAFKFSYKRRELVVDLASGDEKEHDNLYKAEINVLF